MRGFCHKHQMEINDSLVYEAEEEKRLRTREPAKQNEFDSRRLQPALAHLDDMLRKLLNPYDGRYDEVERALEHLRAIREAVSMSATGLPLPSCRVCSRSAPCVYRDFVHCVEWGSTRDADAWCPKFRPQTKGDSMTTLFTYRCKLCGTVFTGSETEAENAWTWMIGPPRAGLVRLMYHECDSGRLGIAELVGCSMEKEQDEDS